MYLDHRGWVLVDVPDSAIEEAHRIREQRDKRYGNIYQVKASDARWVGDLGEICVARWLEFYGISFEWILDQPAGRPDFCIGGCDVGVKTVKRKGPMRTHYTAGITARHAEEPVDHYFFASYEYPQRCLWLLGGIHRLTFLQHAQRHNGGDQVHDSYRIRANHQILNLGVGFLTPPMRWLESLFVSGS